MKKFVEVTLTEIDLADITGNINVIIAKLQRIANENQDAIDINIVLQENTTDVSSASTYSKCIVKAVKFVEQP